MAIQHARVCGACERECPTWANRCPACGSTAISFQMVITAPSGTNIHKLADNAARVRRGRVPVAPASEPGATVRTRA